jgi:TPR repeat protein
LKSISGLLDPDRADEQALIDTFANIQDAQSAMFLPNGVLLPFGDSRLMEASRLRPENNQLLSEYNEKLQYLVSDGEVGEPTLDSLYYSAEAGFASYKSENSSNANSFLAASGWFHSLVHKQLDDLSLVWAENSMLILTDPGRYGYEGKTSNASDLRAKGFYYSDPNRIYVESAHAHNTVEIDNQTDNRREAVAYQSAFTVAAKADNAIILDMDIIREPLVRHQRLCVYIPGQLLAVIDELDSIDDTPHDFTQWWQFFPAWEVVEDLKNSRLSLAYDAEWKHKLENENGTPDADEPEMEAENRKAAHELFSDPEATVHAAFGCHTPEGQKLANRPVHHHGTKDADGKLKGWTSLSPVSLRPAPAVSVALAAPAPKAVMSAVFEFNDKSSQASPPDSVNFKTERRMMNSLSWKSGSSVDDIRYRRRDNKLEIYIGGGRKIELDRTVHPRNEEAQAIMRARAAIASGSEPDEVFRYFDVAARRSWPPAIKEAAKYAHQIGDKDRQLTLSAKAYEVGGSSEILPLALSLITDDPETADLDRAEKLLKEAAENNIRAAHYHLGELYENPDFDRANEEDAKTAYRRGAQLNHSGSILRLAEILEKQGKYPDAVIWYEKVADNDNQKAQLKLADLYSNKAELPELYNPKAALRYYEVAAEKGNKIAGFNGSKLALNKKLDVYDRELGKRLLEIASDAGSGVAAFDLAKLLLEEKQVDRDRAKMLLLMAKNAGINNAKPLLEKLVEEE